VDFDSNGLLDWTVDGREPSEGSMETDELNAIVSDLATEAGLDSENVAWFVAVGQFKAASD